MKIFCGLLFAVSLVVFVTQLVWELLMIMVLFCGGPELVCVQPFLLWIWPGLSIAPSGLLYLSPLLDR